MPSILKVHDTKIVDGDCKPVVLRGAGIGGHLNMENFITGYPGHETQHKEALLKAMGKEKFDFFFEKFYDYYWTEEDAKFYKSVGLNCLRIPFNYRHFLDDSDLFTVKEEGFRLLDRIIERSAKHGIYSVLDLHAVPGGQNQDWHSDSAIHIANFWTYGVFQDAIVNLWKAIAAHYKGNGWVAGYNLLNEPAESKQHRLISFYDRVEKAIREVDPDHILYLDGNTYSMDFTHFPGKLWPNVVLAIHDYANYGFPRNEGYVGSEEQQTKLQNQYNRKIEPVKKLGVPVWNGEFGPVYSSEARGDTDIEKTNSQRYHLLKDQLTIYKKGDPSGDGAPIGWSIWTYKDIGYQGLVYVDPKGPWFKLLGEFFKKKQRLGVDAWGRDPSPEVEALYKSIGDHFRENIPEEHINDMYPGKVWGGVDRFISRVLRECLLSHYMSYEFADYFKDLSFEQLDELAASFKIENCLKRDELNTILAKDAGL